jgi:lipopolysaccharide export system permease protein
MIFQTYLVREFLRFTGLIISFFSVMYSVIDFLEKNARYFPKHNASGRVILEYYLLQLPKMTVELLPFATLFGAIITLWMFSRSGEISAARASGASVAAIGSPLFITGFGLSVCSFLMSEFVVPVAQSRLRYVETVKIEGSKQSRMFLESNWIRSGATVLHFLSYDRIRGVLRSPTLYMLSSANELRWVAQSARASFDSRTESWVLQDAVVTRFDAVLSSAPVARSEGLGLGAAGPRLSLEYVPSLDSRLAAEPPRILSAEVGPNELSFFELLGLIRESQNAGISAQKRMVDLYQKLSMPLANVLFIFLALPFAMRQERQSETYTGILLALCFSLFYWAGNFSLRTLSQGGVLPPFVAAFSMSMLLLIFGIIQVRRLNRSI